MPRVICRLPNASTLINGIKFEPRPDGGMVSEEIDEAVVKNLLRIPGYERVEAPATPPSANPAAGADPGSAATPPADDEKSPEGNAASGGQPAPRSRRGGKAEKPAE